MDKIIGNFFGGALLLVLMLTIGVVMPVQDARIHLKGYDSDGDMLETVGIGQPFTLEVAVENAPGQDRPAIAGLEKAHVRDSGVASITINGHSTMKYTYRVRFDTPGFYRMGPATIVYNGQTLTSQTVVVQVVDQPITTPSKIDKHVPQTAFLRFSANKKRVVVGEKIVCSLRFYYTDEVLNISPITHAPVSGFNFDTKPVQRQGTEKINGIDYAYFELVWDARAVEPGKKVIPAYAIDFSVQSRHTRHHSAASFFFMHALSEQKRVYSNAVTIDVDPLPPHQGPVHAIGSFSNFHAQIEPSTATEGEGMVLTLELEGDGIFDKEHSMTVLQGMPESFKYYDSKNYKDDAVGTHERTKHYFEFIVQGMQQGTWEIPQQSFVYFDSESRTYKTLHTAPISVTITRQTSSKQQYTPPTPAVHNQAGVDVTVADEIRPLARERVDMYGQHNYQIPLWFFVLLASLPLLLVVRDMVGVKSSHWHTRIYGRLHYRNAFKDIRRALNDASHAKNYAAFYPLFVTLFAVRCRVDEQQISPEFMSERLQKAGMHQAELETWHQFVTQLSEYVFFNKQATSREQQGLLLHAYRWVDRLEKIL